MNCAVCCTYLAFKNNSPLNKGTGCRPRNKQSAFLKKKCKDDLKLLKGGISFCNECNFYQCENLSCLDFRYRYNYGMSMIDILNFIRDNGMTRFTKREVQKYKCQKGVS